MGIENKRHVVRTHFCIAACLNIGHVLVGYTVAWTAPMIPKLQDPQQSPLSTPVSLTEASWIGSSFTIGVIIGPYLLAHLSNTIGRKHCLVLSVILSCIGYFFISLAKSCVVILTGRVICGLGLGALSVLDLVYIGEIASPNIRGIMLTLTGVFHTLGTLIVYSVGPFISYAATGYIALSISLFYVVVCMAYLPESPLYYILKGNEEEAIKILHFLGRDKDMYKELRSLNDDVTQNRLVDWKWKELYSIKTNRRSFVITVFIYIFQECCGIISVAYYATTIFQNAGSSIDPPIATIIVGVTQFVTTLIVPSLIEKLGRKTLLLISTAGCGLCMAILGIYFYLDYLDHSYVSTVGWLPLAILALSYCSYGIGLNIVPNTLLGEMYCPNMRSIGTSLSMTLGWVAGFFSLTSFGYIVEAFGSYMIFGTFAIVNVFGFIFVVFVVPETKGMSLREIQIMLSR